ncbi:acylamino-acid-releasing enzyme-like isoform X2 [Apostichopus japonicus]
MSLDKAVSVYRELASVPTLLSAQITHQTDNFNVISSTWKQRDIERGDHVTFSRSHVLLGQGLNALPMLDGTEMNGEILSAFSACSKYKALIRRVTTDKGDDDQEYLEIWTCDAKQVNINLTLSDKHGKVYSDENFGCLNWSSDSSKVLYIAEKKRPKTVSLFERQSSPPTTVNEQSNAKPEDKYLFRDDWGERYEDLCYPVICIFDVIQETICVLDEVPAELSPAQAIWGPDNLGIIFCGIYHEPYKLGILWSAERRSAIFHFGLLGKKSELLSVDDMCCRSPRCSPDGSKVIFLQNEIHKHSKLLMLFDLTRRSISVIIDVVARPSGADQFPGLYTDSLPLRCFGKDNETVYIHSQWRSKQKILAVNTSTKRMSELNRSLAYSSWMVLDVKGDMILARRGAPNATGQMVICDLSLSNGEWIVLEDNKVRFEDFKWEIFSRPRPDGLEVECILLTPQVQCNRDRRMPMVVYPHGGPHLFSRADYHVLLTFLCKLNFVILCVNYRGSSGFGHDFVLSLQGKIGSQDVYDVHQEVLYVLKHYNVNEHQIAVLGGSHGGFIALHLIGRYPELYKVCALRNAVSNIAEMLEFTDVPDWCFAEVGLKWSYEVDTSSAYTEMLKRSPVLFLPQITAPTLFLVGKKDQRVPPKQSVNLYKKLRARGVKTKLLFYPYDHGLQQVDAESDTFINIYKWFQENLMETVNNNWDQFV